MRAVGAAGKADGDGQRLAAWQSMVSGGSAAVLGPTVTNPFDVIKVPPPRTLCARTHARTPARSWYSLREDELSTAAPTPRPAKVTSPLTDTALSWNI